MGKAERVLFKIPKHFLRDLVDLFEIEKKGNCFVEFDSTDGDKDLHFYFGKEDEIEGKPYTGEKGFCVMSVLEVGQAKKLKEYKLSKKRRK